MTFTAVVAVAIGAVLWCGAMSVTAALIGIAVNSRVAARWPELARRYNRMAMALIKCIEPS